MVGDVGVKVGRLRGVSERRYVCRDTERTHEYTKEECSCNRQYLIPGGVVRVKLN